MGEYQRIRHDFEPVYNAESKVLILGSLPSVKSREAGFYYGHPRNRFWTVLAKILQYEEEKLITIEGKKEMLLTNHIAIWDVVESCDIKGSSDSSIRNVKTADIGRILTKADILAIYANGKTAGRLYHKYLENKLKRPIFELPSTSPANAAFSLEKLLEIWGNELRQYLV